MGNIRTLGWCKLWTPFTVIRVRRLSDAVIYSRCKPNLERFFSWMVLINIECKQQLWVSGVDIDIIEFAPLNVCKYSKVESVETAWHEELLSLRKGRLTYQRNNMKHWCQWCNLHEMVSPTPRRQNDMTLIFSSLQRCCLSELKVTVCICRVRFLGHLGPCSLCQGIQAFSLLTSYQARPPWPQFRRWWNTSARPEWGPEMTISDRKKKCISKLWVLCSVLQNCWKRSR